MDEFLGNAIVILYFITAFMLMLYGLNCYVMLFLFQKGWKRAELFRQKVEGGFNNILDREDLPAVTTQIPVYNELNVIERIIRSASLMEYPPEKHEIQILDDSTDKTSEFIDRLASELHEEGVNIKVIRRKTREGFKAGALANGFDVAQGELTAIFDADFVPPKDYLLKTVRYFMADENLGLVQARWGHLNRRKSLLTRLQSIGIDGHFMIEQSARNWGNLFMNFNGTAGVWRKQAIADGGGWEWDTLTEDMDLSYRVQAAGWGAVYLPDLIVPAEIPEDINAFKSQQFRWAKGSIQTALKLLPRLLQSPIPLFKKIEAFFHLTHYLVHPMMLTLALLALPVLMLMKFYPGPVVLSGFVFMVVLAMSAPSTLYFTSQKSAYKDWKRRIVFLPFLVMVGVGIAASNSKAVMEALIGHKSGFVRTPKKGDKEIINYRKWLPWGGTIEIVIGIYCAWSFGYYLFAGKYIVGPFLAIYSFGFLFTGFLTFAHSLGRSE
ncbi:MAG: glycosyltransferase [Deltaproteobacteria bacterium]|nr:glycosyltransferase [Deltaproteobacteria bacterium]